MDRGGEFGPALRTMREQRQWTLSRLARRAHYSDGYISRVERGEKRPSLQFAETVDSALGADGALVSLVMSEQSAAAFPARKPAQLPLTASMLVGRDEALAALDEALLVEASDTMRVAVVDGSAGMGKTSVALSWAHANAELFTDGQLFSDLHGYDGRRRADPADVLDGFLRDIGVPAAAIPSGLEARARYFRSLIAGRRLLVVLDNADTSEQVLPLLPATPGCAVLVTSRSRLSGVAMRSGAQHVTLRELREHESLDLLRQVAGTDRVAREPEAAAAIARRCAHLPLAVRIAADYVAARPNDPLADLADQLAAEARLDVLVPVDAPDLRAVFSWSYRALPDESARVFRLLGVSGYGLSLRAVAALTGLNPTAAREALDRLRAAHLVEPSSQRRVRLHDLLRTYARELCTAHDAPADRLAAMERLLAWYLHTAASANDTLAPARGQPDLPPLADGLVPEEFGSYADALQWCQREQAALRILTETAAAEGYGQSAWLLAAVQFHYFFLTKPLNDWLRITEAGLRGARSISDRYGEAWCLHNLGAGRMERRELDRAADCFRSAIRIREELEDWWGLGWSCLAMGRVQNLLERFDDAREWLLRSAETFARIDFTYGIAGAYVWLGETYTHLHQYDSGREVLLRSIEMFADAMDGSAHSWRYLAWLEWSAGSYEDAKHAARRALSSCEALADDWGRADALLVLGRAERDSGDGTAARASLAAAAETFDGLLDERAHDARLDLDQLGVLPEAEGGGVVA